MHRGAIQKVSGQEGKTWDSRNIQNTDDFSTGSSAECPGRKARILGNVLDTKRKVPQAIARSPQQRFTDVNARAIQNPLTDRQ
jgi:hypothetical protein